MTAEAVATDATVGGVVATIEARYPPSSAADWDRVGLTVGDPAAAPVRRVLLAVDCVSETVDEAVACGADLMVVHHPLLLRGVHSVATTSYKGRLVHRLIRAGVALYVAHTNADVATPGVTDALAARLLLRDVRPLLPTGHPCRIGMLAQPRTLGELVAEAARLLPPTAAGVRGTGDPDRRVRSLAVVGGAGDAFLGDVAAAGVDAYLTADLRHHVASEHMAAGGPALIDAAHWATERPWLDQLAEELRRDAGVETIVSDLVTDVWTAHAHAQKEPRT